eukprot:JP447668.1.p2 GENE.JP447668.1~~JP447668.1.p2  ORF type:complete len:144 (+),score=70.73 JP447668.1:37-468(+)
MGPFSVSPPMSQSCTIRTRKFITNRLLARKQFVIDIIHPGRPNVPKAEVTEKIAKIYKADEQLVSVFGFKTAFGGGRTTGFGLVYDNLNSIKAFEPNYRLVRKGLKEAVKTSRKQRKERKNRAKRVTGIKKTKILAGQAAGKK